ncbi:UNVERIFIED_CONTAM: hypothetical protein RMT77_011004 [Armadillidium vulgare]
MKFFDESGNTIISGFVDSSYISGKEMKMKFLLLLKCLWNKMRERKALLLPPWSKGPGDRPIFSHGVYMEKDKEKEIELGRTQTPEWDRVKARETEERGCSIQITISSGNESQIERPSVGKPELESERKVKSNSFNRKSIVEKKKEERIEFLKEAEHHRISITLQESEDKRTTIQNQSIMQLKGTNDVKISCKLRPDKGR